MKKKNEDSVDGNDDAYGYYHVYYGCSGDGGGASAAGGGNDPV